MGYVVFGDVYSRSRETTRPYMQRYNAVPIATIYSVANTTYEVEGVDPSRGEFMSGY